MSTSRRDSVLTSKLAYRALVCAVPILILFSMLGKGEEGIGAWICTTIVLLVVGVRWDLRRRYWFWIAIGFGFLLQTPLIFLVPWNNRNLIWITVLPLGVLDYFLVYYCVKTTERLTASNHGKLPP